MKIPPHLLRSVQTRWPDRADVWLTHVESELDELCRRFSATPKRVLPARYAFVVSADSPYRSLIMRATLDPDAAAQTSVAKALAQLGVGPTIHTTSTSDTGTWTVMDQVTPGTPLADIDPATLNLDELTAPLRTMAGVPAPDDTLPNITDWLRDRLSSDHLADLPPGETTASRTERTHALHVLDKLNTNVRYGLCHGDTSPWNILVSAARQWKLIDPRGMRGEVEYDAAVLAIKIAAMHRVYDATTRVAEAVQLDHTRVHAWAIVAQTARV